MASMNNLDKDILRDNPELRKNAFAVPEGYFEGLKAGLKNIPQTKGAARKSPWKPVISIAAAIILLLAAGSFFLATQKEDNILTEDDYIVYSDELTYILMQEYYDQYAQAQELTEDDIIDYLIYTGVEVEEIENY